MKEDLYNQIDRYIGGISDEKERKQVESLFLQGEDELYFRERLNRDWDAMLKDDTAGRLDLNHILCRIYSIILKNDDLKRNTPWNRLIHNYRKVAAILLLPIILTFGAIYTYQLHRDHAGIDHEATSTIYAPMGARVAFNLPDGTTGMLNSGSKLSYSLPFTGSRRITFEGEAWFDVKHDEKHPFQINIGDTALVSVLGTSFNLSAYKSDHYVELVLKEGKVEFRDTRNNEKILLAPSERLVFLKDGTDISLVDPAKYKAWTEGKLVFKNDKMSEVIRRIERWYNVKINLADSELDKYSFHATFENDNIEDVLKFLAMISPIRYKICKGKMLPDGTFRKEVITISKRTDY